MKFVDNLLDQNVFDELQKFLLGSDFDWRYNSIIDSPEDEGKFQFVHTFYKGNISYSPFIERINPILKILNPISLIRIKANLITKTPNCVVNKFHSDIDRIDSDKIKLLTTSIFYLNTNNGYTEFQDGTKVESVANRILTFPANLKHRGTSCTDSNIRVVINFNYF